MKRIVTEYTYRAESADRQLRLAVASDLHSDTFDDVLEEFSRCDAVLIPGDLVDRHRRNNENAERFLTVVPDITPVFYSIGNHERKFKRREEYLRKVKESRVTLLDNESADFHGIRIGGLSSSWTKRPDPAFLDVFEREAGFKLLLCHHPEMWRDYVAGRNIDLTLCGHAHGGQMQFFGRGLYAPGQGLFPKLTHGVHGEGTMIISRGMTNGAKPRVPRINNPCEMIILNLDPEGVRGQTKSPRGKE